MGEALFEVLDAGEALVDGWVVCGFIELCAAVVAVGAVGVFAFVALVVAGLWVCDGAWH